MHAFQPITTGNAPAQPTVPVDPHQKGRLCRGRRLRRAVSSASIIFACAAALGLASTASFAGRDRAPWNQGDHQRGIPGAAAITINDLPASLNLSAEQRTQLQAAMAEIHRERSILRHRWFGAGDRGSRHDGAGPRWRGGPGLFARRHYGDRPGFGFQPGRGYGSRRGFGPPHGHRPDGRPGVAFEPPMIQLLERSSSILNGDQFVILAQFLADRRAEMRPGPGEAPALLDGPFGRLAARRLGLTDEQKSQLKPLFATFGEGMRPIRDGLDAGTMTPEQARDRAKELRLALEKGAQGVLSPDQWKKVQKFREKRRERQFSARIHAQPQRVDRMTGAYVRILGLDGAQASQVRQIMEATIPARRAAAEQATKGAMAPEDFAYEMMTIGKNAAGQVRATLNPDQAKRFDALAKLFPRGLEMGGPIGPGMGRPMEGPGGEREGGWRGGR